MLASRCAAISYPTLKYISCGSGPSPKWSRALSLFACRASRKPIDCKQFSIDSWHATCAPVTPLVVASAAWPYTRGVHLQDVFVSRKQKDIASKWKRLINAVNFTGKKLKIVLINIFIDINVILHEILFAKMEFYHWPTSLLIFLSHLFYVSLIQS